MAPFLVPGTRAPHEKLSMISYTVPVRNANILLMGPEPRLERLGPNKYREVQIRFATSSIVFPPPKHKLLGYPRKAFSFE